MEVPTTVDTKPAGQQDELIALEATQELPGCEHHWVIERPAGPISKGACRNCGEERDFLNYIEGGWGGDVSLEQLSGGSRLPSSIDVSSRDRGKFEDDA